MENFNLGHAIRSFRKKAGKTQEFFAEEISISPDHLSRIENNKRMPSVILLVEIAKKLNKPLWEIMLKAEGYNAHKQDTFSSLQKN